MKILLIHSYYQKRGGEDVVFESETELLKNNGHDVVIYTKQNSDLEQKRFFSKLFLPIWNHSVYKEVIDLIQKEQPDLVHVHNTFPYISPSVFWAVKKHSRPVVLTLHNYRLLCLNALFYIKNKPCEKCIKKRIPWPGLLLKCYRGQIFTSLVLFTINTVHKLIGTWDQKIDFMIAPSLFLKEKFNVAGYPDHKIIVKPHFLNTKTDLNPPKEKKYILYVGRISKEKGIEELINTYLEHHLSVPLYIAGTGPLFEKLKLKTKENPYIHWLGYQAPDTLPDIYDKAAFCVYPTQVYESFGLGVIQSYQHHLPVIAPNQGAVKELITDNKTGFLYKPNDNGDLALKINILWNEAELRMKMGEKAHQYYIENFTESKNYEQLHKIYSNAIKLASA